MCLILCFGTLLFALYLDNYGHGFVMSVCKRFFFASILHAAANNQAECCFQFISLVNRDCSSLLVQGDRWANYDDCMSYEEECKFVVSWWRRLNGMDEPPRKTMFVPNIMVLKKAVLAVRNEAEKCAAVNNSQPQQSVYVTFKLLLVFITRLVTLYCAGVRKPKTFVRIVVRRCHAAAEGCCDRLVCFPAC